VEKPAPKKSKEAVTKDTWKSMVGLEDGTEVVEEQGFFRKLTDDAPIYRKSYKYSDMGPWGVR
jgi:nicotinamide mononucleotide adenylyltransferase